MTVNPRTRTKEYWATIDSRVVKDGRIELRARVIPKVGRPIVLQGKHDDATGIHSAWLYANAGHALVARKLCTQLFLGLLSPHGSRRRRSLFGGMIQVRFLPRVGERMFNVENDRYETQLVHRTARDAIGFRMCR